MERKHMILDGISTLDSFNDPSIKSIVIFVHGIFGGCRETWGATTNQLATTPLFVAFDYASYGYTSKLIELGTPDLFVDQLILWIRTHLSCYENIFFVSHSMGGLLVRHAVVRMLRTEGDWVLVRKIRRCFMIASPVSGSRIARLLSRIPFLTRLNRRLSYLANPTIDGKDMSAAYSDAAAIFQKNGGSPADVPRFNYFVGTDDRIVSPPEKLFYTPFDKYEGSIPGTHGKLKLDLDANSVLIKRITQLVQDSSIRSETSQRDRITMAKEASRRRELAMQERSSPIDRFMIAGQEMIDLVLISCSATKTDANEESHPRDGGMAEQVADSRLAQLALEMRSRVLRLIQEGKIDGIEFAQGNRISMPVNQRLLVGPDFGGISNEMRYLPARDRYKGRCYQALQEEWLAMLCSVKHPQFLIMSGLYGLVPPTEYIQNYDVHLTDVDMSTGVSLQTYWRDRDLMTQILISHLEWVEKTKGPIGRVIDALSELSYQETINWSLIDCRWNVLHRVFQSNAGRNALGNLGVWIRDIIREPSKLRGIEADKFYENSSFHPLDRIAFEARIGGSPLAVSREIAD